jgi:hypothetical protein
MARPLEYHMDVRGCFLPTALVLALAGTFLFSTGLQAQINAPPTSVTSPGFGGRAINGTPPSVTSLGPRGFAPNAGVPFRAQVNGSHNGHHRRNGDNSFVGPYLYAYPVPYAVDSNDYTDAPDAAEDDTNYQGGPTVFDRRGSGARSYVPPVDDPPAAHPDVESDPVASDPPPAAPPTVLVFKDGHQLEVSNYAIVGNTLFDLTPGHSRRIALADLNLDRTRQQNEENGIVFQLPAGTQAD